MTDVVVGSGVDAYKTVWRRNVKENLDNQVSIQLSTLNLKKQSLIKYPASLSHKMSKN